MNTKKLNYAPLFEVARIIISVAVLS